MPESSSAELRIYCICGQKMKVSEAMFGLPGKCVACRQKIRIPRRDELSPDTAQLFLKDHPEFLRKSRRPKAEPAAAELAEKAADEKDLPLGDGPPVSSGTMMLDILEPLRVLCSLEYKINRQLEGLREPGVTTPADEGDRAGLAAYLERVRAMRTDFDEQLRHRLMEVVIDLAGTQEKIIQVGLSTRIGEIDGRTFQEHVDQLRRRRDALERLQQNLRGWLTVDNPHEAGGYSNVAMESVPGEGFRVSLPLDEPPLGTLLDFHIDGLREALLRRERAERRLEETKRLEAEGTMSALVLADCRADCEGERRRAECEVTFRRKRLEAMKSDAVADIQSLDAYLETQRKKAESGTLEKSRYASVERDILRAQRDCRKLDDWATRALVASTADDVPHPQGTFMKRMVHVKPQRIAVNLGAEAWVAWICAFLMGVTVFLPAVDGLSPLEAFRSFHGQPYYWVMVLPLALGALTAASQVLRPAVPRGILLLMLWMLVTIAGAAGLHEAQYSFTTMAVRFRQGGAWWTQWALAIMVLANFGVLAAAAMALTPLKKYRSLPPFVAVLTLTILVALFTNVGGYFEPRPVVNTKSIQRFQDDRLVYESSIFVQNTGARDFVILAPTIKGPNVYAYALERLQEQDWVAVGMPEKVVSTPQTVADSMKTAGGIVVPAHSSAVLQYRLPPGEYRVGLKSTADPSEKYDKRFVLDAPVPLSAPAEPPASVPTLPADPAPAPRTVTQPVVTPVEPAPEAPATPAEPVAPEKETPQPVEAPAAETPPAKTSPTEPAAAEPAAPAYVPADVELRGVIVAGRKEPRFSVIVYYMNGTSRVMDLFVGDIVHEPWVLSEFNAARQSVTLSNGESILILNRGERIRLE